MKPAAEMYPEHAKEAAESGHFYGPCDYSPIIAAVGEVLVRADDNDYQGDTYALVRGPEGRLGYLTIGWGSCSGCDALQGCNTLTEIDGLAQGIENGVRWFGSDEEARAWFKAHDWAADFGSWHEGGLKAFLARAWEVLGIDGAPPELRE